MNEKMKTLQIVFTTANKKYTTNELASTQQTCELLVDLIENNIDTNRGSLLGIVKSSEVITVRIDTTGFTLVQRASLDTKLRELVAYFSTYFSAPSFISKVEQLTDDQFKMAVYSRKSNNKLICNVTDLFELTSASLKVITYQENEYVSTGKVVGTYHLISRYDDEIKILGETIEFRDEEGVCTLSCGSSTHSYDTRGFFLPADLAVTLSAS